MKIVTSTTTARRTTTLTALTITVVLLVAGAAAGAYSGKIRTGEILTCFARSDGAVRIVDHLPCRKGETPLQWNAQGMPGADGKAGRDGADGKTGPAGERGTDGGRGADGERGASGSDGSTGAGQAGAAGQNGAAGTPGTTGEAGARGDAGPAGPAGTDGTRGADGAAGPAGPRGEQGPAGPASSSSGMQLGHVTNSTDPDCAMAGPIGRTTAGICNFGAAHTLGEYLPSSAVISGFRVLLDQAVSTPTDILARVIDPATGGSVQAFALCTVPAGSNTCAQTGERTITGPNLFTLQFSGDRSWTTARFGYSLVQA